MKIGFDAKRAFNNSTGLGNYSRDLIRILAHHYPEHEYHLYTPKIAEKYQYFGANQTIHLPKNIFHKMVKSYWRSKGVTQDLKNKGIDIYHGLSGELPVGLRKAGIKSVVTIHDLIFMRYPQYYKAIDRKMYEKKFGNACKNADAIVAISEQTKRDIVDFLKIPEERIRVIYQGCHQAFKNSYTEEAQKKVAAKYSLPQKFLLNVGTIEERKNILNVVKAIKNLDTPLVIIGRATAYTAVVKKYITDNNMTDKVLFLEVVNMEELAVIYQLATVFVYPSVFEGFGIPIIEALYSKTPVITTGSGVFPEAGGPSSCYIDPNGIMEIADAITRLLSDDILRKKMAEDGFQFVQKFNDDVITTQWNEVYGSI